MSTQPQPTTSEASTDETPVHSRLLREPTKAVDPLSFVAHVREELEGMPETKATFGLPDIGRPYVRIETVQPLIEFAGAWRLPEYYSRGDGPTFINPSAVHAHCYPGVDVCCQCGTRMLDVNHNSKDTQIVTGLDDHRDDCLGQWRHRARARILETRAEAFRRRGRWGHAEKDIQPMLGIKHSAHSMSWSVGVDRETVAEEHRQRTANTAAELLHYRPSEDVAAAYGYTKRHISRLVRERTPYSPQELYNKRRREGHDR